MKFKNRGIVITPDNFNGVDWIAKMKNSGLNILGIQAGEGEGIDVLKRLQWSITDEFRKNASDAGISLEYEIHTASSLVPRELFDTNPEYFVMNQQENCRTSNYNFCPTNTDVKKIITNNAIKIASHLNSAKLS